MFNPAYDRELHFFLEMLGHSNLPVNFIKEGEEGEASLDNGLRKVIYPQLDSEAEIKKLLHSVKERTVYNVRDEFLLNYIFFLLPDSEPVTLACIGPYTSTDINSIRFTLNSKKQTIHPEWFAVLERFYSSVLYLPDERDLLIAVNTLGNCLWKEGFNLEVLEGKGIKDHEKLFAAPEHKIDEPLESDIRLIEYRYEAENRFMEAISKGRIHQVETMLSGFDRSSVDERVPEPTRNAKNYLIILNTVMRKATEAGNVHPLLIHRASEHFAKKIEKITNWAEVYPLCSEMGYHYCNLVKNHSMEGYSPAVQKAVTRIEFDLSADLSLKATADALGVNASYLSTTFRKETSLTITEYVARKRVEHALFLLENTDMPVSVIGHQCGISDNNYFTKIFKKYAGKTPVQVRSDSRRERVKPKL